MTNLDSILKSREITLPTKVHLVNAMVFPVVMYESWVLKNWWFGTVVLEKTLESSLDYKEIQPVHPKGDQSWVFEGLMLKLKLQYFGHLMLRADSVKRPWCWERLKAGGEGDDRGWDDWMASPTQCKWIWVNSGSLWWTERPGMLQSMGYKESDMTDRLNWTELNWADLCRNRKANSEVFFILQGVPGWEWDVWIQASAWLLRFLLPTLSSVSLT